MSRVHGLHYILLHSHQQMPVFGPIFNIYIRMFSQTTQSKTVDTGQYHKTRGTAPPRFDRTKATATYVYLSGLTRTKPAALLHQYSKNSKGRNLQLRKTYSRTKFVNTSQISRRNRVTIYTEHLQERIVVSSLRLTETKNTK